MSSWDGRGNAIGSRLAKRVDFFGGSLLTIFELIAFFEAPGVNFINILCAPFSNER